MNKKIFSGLLASTMMLSMAGVATATETPPLSPVEQQTLTSATDFLFENGKILAYLGSGGRVEIPSTINGEPVVEIGRDAFAHCDTLTSIVIPSSVTAANEAAFSYCPQLTEAHIPESLTGIGFHLFLGSDNVTIYGASSSEGGEQTVAEFIAQWNELPFVSTSVNESQDEVYSLWAEPFVDQAKVYNLITPSLGKQYNVDIYRLQIAEILVQLVENYTGELLPVSDVVFQDTTDIAVQKAYGAGIISGLGNGLFGASDTATREQIALMMAKTIDVLEEKTGRTLIQRNTELTGFLDEADLSIWAGDGMAILVNNGIMKGVSDSYLSPLTNTTIEQCFVMVNQIFGLSS